MALENAADKAGYVRNRERAAAKRTARVKNGHSGPESLRLPAHIAAMSRISGADQETGKPEVRTTSRLLVTR